MRNLPVRFCGTGSYAPEEVLDNQYFADRLDTSDEWIRTRSGISTRRRAAPDQATSDMGAEAAKRALEAAGIAPTDLGLIVCATATGDHPFPATAAIIQGKIGASGVPSFDISAACAGFLYGLCTAGSMLAAGACEYALVLGAETLTRVADPEDRGTVVLFGDAAGAAVLGRSEDPAQSLLYCNLGSDGSRADYIWVPAGGSRLPASEMTVSERLHYLRMKGREVYKFAVTKLQELIDNALEETGLKPEDLKLVIPHQSNLRIIESARERLGLPPEKVAVNIDRYGNTSAASVITSLDESLRDGTLQRGDHVLMVGIGAGLTWGSAVVRL